MKIFVTATIPLFSVQVLYIQSKCNAYDAKNLPMGTNGCAHDRFDVDRVRLVIVA